MTKKEITKFIDHYLEFSRKILKESGNYPQAYGSLEKAFEILREEVNAKKTTIVFAGKKYKFTFGSMEKKEVI